MAPPPAFLDERYRGVRGAHGRHHIDGETLFPACLVVGGPEPGGVVDENIDAAERIRSRRDVGRNRVLVGQGRTRRHEL